MIDFFYQCLEAEKVRKRFNEEAIAVAREGGE